MPKIEKTNSFNMKNLKTIREQRKITQVKLSIDMEVSQELISQYECGTSLPTIANLTKLADYFNCSTDYLLGRTDIISPIKNLDKKDAEIAELIHNYQKLPKDKKNQVNSFLKFISQNEEV